MADIAFVFHWPPSAMDDMGLEELGRWREKARERNTPKKRGRTSRNAP